MTDDRKPDAFRDLDERLRQARSAADKSAGRAPSKADSRSGLGFALRLGVELVSALVIGVAIGYFLDLWLGTLPLFLLIFFVLGAAAGFMGVYRAATGLGQTVGYRQDRQDSKKDDGGGDQAR